MALIGVDFEGFSICVIAANPRVSVKSPRTTVNLLLEKHGFQIDVLARAQCAAPLQKNWVL
jgi:hypothetical protein